MPEDEDEEELLPSQGHEAEGVEGQCSMKCGSLRAGSWPGHACAHGDLGLQPGTGSQPSGAVHTRLSPASVQLWPCAQVGWAFPLRPFCSARQP